MKVERTDLLLMITSTGLALLLWIWIGAQERSEIVVSVPLEYRDLPRGLEISSEQSLVSEVNVWVKGTTTGIKNLQPKEVSAWVDLGNATAGKRIFELTPDSVRVPYGFSVIRVTPSQLNFRIEAVVYRTVSVIPRLEGEPPEGYSIKETVVTPPEVEVVGPQSAVTSIRHVITDSIDVSAVKSDLTSTVNVGVENSAVRLGNTKRVTVMLRIVEIEDVMTLRNVPVSVAGATGAVRFNPRVIRLDLQAPKRILAKLSESNIKAVLNVAELKQGTYELTPEIQMEEEGATVTGMIPERIKVRIE